MPIVFGKDGLTGQTAQQAFGRGNWMAKKERPAIDWLRYEKEALTQGYTAVCGIDEAGRGPLAGPVYAAAVILPPGVMIDGVNDSKKLSAKKREALFDVICEQATAYAITCAEVSEIEQLNILQATFLAMRRAVAELSAAADFAIVDGNRLPGLSIPSRAVVSGDAELRQCGGGVGSGEGQPRPLYAADGCALSSVRICAAQGLRHRAACGAAA